MVDLPVTPTLADGLAGAIDEASFARARHAIHDIVLVEEAAIAESIRALYVDDGVVAEGSAAVAVAALERIDLEGPVALVITGGNIDAAKLAAIFAES